MSDTPADFAVFGSTPLARLLAGLLASAHGKRVIWLGDSHAAFRLPRGIDLSVSAATRPESWALLARTVPETVKILARAGGKAGTMRLDPILFADTAVGQQALAFMRSSAAGFGPVIEQLPSRRLGSGRDGIVLRDAIVLHRDRLESTLDCWLDSLGVIRLPLARAQTALDPDGSATIELETTPHRAMRTILADDEALLAYLPPDMLAALFERQTMTTILTEPTLPLAAPVMMQVDADLSLMQGARRAITAIGAGDHENCVGQIGVLLGANRQLRQAGGTSHERLRSRDGAALLGRIGDTGPDILAGLGPSGAFLAPALARWLAGTATAEELAYCDARSPDRPLASSLVAEYVPGVAA